MRAVRFGTRNSRTTFLIAMVIVIIVTTLAIRLRGDVVSVQDVEGPENPVASGSTAGGSLSTTDGDRDPLPHIASDVTAEERVPPRVALSKVKPEPRNYWNLIPDVDRCMASRFYNPGMLELPTAAAREELARLISDLNLPIAQLAESRSELITKVAKSKAVDGPEDLSKTSAYPDDLVIARAGFGRWEKGNSKAMHAIVVVGDDADLDSTIRTLIDVKFESCEKVKQKILELCGG